MTKVQNIIDEFQSKLKNYESIIPPNDKKVINENIARLYRINELLDVDKYKLVFIGAPGSGKTTLICNYLDLLRDDFINKEPNDVPLLNTASGRTTAAEVHILKGKRTLIRIEPCKIKEQEGIVRIYCRTLWDKIFDTENEASSNSESAELDRIVRNMAGYSKNIDIENEIRENYKPEDYNKFCDYMIKKTCIHNRKTILAIYDGTTDFKLWLKKTFSDINLGKAEKIPIPKRIFIQIAEYDYDFSLPEWADEVIDTRGFDGEGRLDVKSLIYQDNTINIILDKITTPIDERLHPIFNSWVVKENVDIIPRLSLVIACRNNELSSVCEAEDEDEGEEIKRSEIGLCIKANNLNYENDNTIFYNAQGAYETKNAPRKSGTKIHNVSVITNIDAENAELYRSFFSEEITGIKDKFRNELIIEAEDISQRTLNIFNNLKKQPTLYDTERNRVVSKLEELKTQALSTFKNNKSVINSFDTMFNKIKYNYHWATVRKTTEMYGEWSKCNIYGIIQGYLWSVVSNEFSDYKNQIDQLLNSIDPRLSNYIKSYQAVERKNYLKLKAYTEAEGYKHMLKTFNVSTDEPRKEFWDKARAIHGRGYLANVIDCYKNWIDNTAYDKGLCEIIYQCVSDYFDSIIEIVS